ncbi:methylated-DNA--protein-cysteine methyltransferase [Listeria fleischmannii FSL S10-1203]|uniref:Methylated-DNA--protein-cysteine methyltransferase n=1 Tax=Listeria fleischmannii FSL S10-1203 TaxID=1265822 RepID=W7DNA9_9LIST|nr:methylated-DNA--protein-cysteine methyltransferase [Listeria fleischmannii FSL S10-1203]
MASKAFIDSVYSVIKRIPKGKVTTYGQIAYMIQHPQNARLVGNVLKHTDRTLNLPCHRVVNSAGRTVPGWPEQITLLQQEQVPFKKKRLCRLKTIFLARLEMLLKLN